MVCFGPHVNRRAGDGNRTHTTSLEGWSSTIELHPQPTEPESLRTRTNLHPQKPLSLPAKSWREQDSNLRRHCHQIYSLAPLATRVSRRNITYPKNDTLNYAIGIKNAAEFRKKSQKTEPPDASRSPLTDEPSKLAVGFEPTTTGLQNRYSAVELR